MTRYVTTLELVKDYFAYRLNTGENYESAESTSNENIQECRYISKDLVVSFRRLAIRAENENRECFDLYLEKILFDKHLSNNQYYNNNHQATTTSASDYNSQQSNTESSTKMSFENRILNKAKQITDLVFDDNCINWGRITILISFFAYLTFKYTCKVNNLKSASSLACKLIEWLTFYITCKYGIWIECNGGWVRN
jgi:hypothetical protein